MGTSKLHITGWVSYTENQQRNDRANPHDGPTGSNLYLQHLSFLKYRIHVLQSVSGTFSRADHILGHTSSTNKSKNIETVPSIFDCCVYTLMELRSLYFLTGILWLMLR